MQYPENKLSVSYGLLYAIYEDKKYNFNHLCSTRGGSSGSPILNINNKIIGIHKEDTEYTEQFNQGTFLNYPIKEFIELNNNDININEILLKDLNNAYKLNITDTKINKLNLGYKNLGNKELNDLCKIEFKQLKELFLYINKITDIKVLENVKFENLEKLYLSNNRISDINILEKVNFKELKELVLDANKISDIKVLEKVKFNKLEILHLSDNQISKSQNETIISKLKSKIKELYI